MNTRTWAEINLDALSDNIKEIRKITNENAKVMAVVKADAYGHGAVDCSRVLIENGAEYLAVATADEALSLRRNGIDTPVLILGSVFDEDIYELIKNDITLTVFTFEFAKKISSCAKELKRAAKIHIKIDTGMTRIGYVAGICDDNITDEILELSKLDNIEIEGIFSHFSTSDEKNQEFTLIQFDKFMNVCRLLEEKGVKIPLRHIANSAAIMMYPETHLDMVRAGICLYGFYPSDEVIKDRLPLKKVMTFKTRITRIDEFSEDVGVSYGRTYITKGKTVIATIPVGYADGYTRMLGGHAKVLVKGEPVDVIGRICMDQCMIDVTNVHNISTGDEVILFGEETITADTLASWLGTISYEIVCMISKRIPRIFKQNGRTVNTLNYLLKF